jgi:DNA polymerase-3 subunit gamma/tau
MLGAVDRSHVWILLQALADGNGVQVVQTVDGLRINGFSAAAALDDMTAVLQRMAVAQWAPGALSSEDPDDAEVARLAELLPPDQTQLLYSLCLHGRQELGLAPDEYAALTMVLLRLLAFRPNAATALNSAAEKKSLKSAVSVPPAVRPPAPPPPPVAAPPSEARAGLQPAISVQQVDVAAAPTPARFEPAAPAPSPDPVTEPAPALGDFWHQTVMGLLQADAVVALVRELALQSSLLNRQDGRWTLRVPNAALLQANARERLQAALQQTGHAIELVTELGTVDDSPARRLAAAASERQRLAEQAILQDPLVQALQRDFGGKILPGSIQPL